MNNGQPEATTSLLTEEVAEALLKGYAESNPGKVLDSKDFALILKWAEETEVSRHLLHGILKGEILPSVKKGAVVFSVSKKGIDRVGTTENGINIDTIIKLPNSEKVQ